MRHGRSDHPFDGAVRPLRDVWPEDHASATANDTELLRPVRQRPVDVWLSGDGDGDGGESGDDGDVPPEGLTEPPPPEDYQATEEALTPDEFVRQESFWSLSYDVAHFGEITEWDDPDPTAPTNGGSGGGSSGGPLDGDGGDGDGSDDGGFGNLGDGGDGGPPGGEEEEGGVWTEPMNPGFGEGNGPVVVVPTLGPDDDEPPPDLPGARGPTEGEGGPPLDIPTDIEPPEPGYGDDTPEPGLNYFRHYLRGERVVVPAGWNDLFERMVGMQQEVEGPNEEVHQLLAVTEVGDIVLVGEPTPVPGHDSLTRIEYFLENVKKHILDREDVPPEAGEPALDPVELPPGVSRDDVRGDVHTHPTTEPQGRSDVDKNSAAEIVVHVGDTPWGAAHHTWIKLRRELADGSVVTTIFVGRTDRPWLRVRKVVVEPPPVDPHLHPDPDDEPHVPRP